jgi:hypothetical protein
LVHGTREGTFHEAQLVEIRNVVGNEMFEAMVSAARAIGSDDAVARALASVSPGI